MLLTPAERDRLLIYTAAELARARRARGLRLNVPETIALVADTVCEAARDGARHADALASGKAVLGPDDVLPGVADVVPEVRVEAGFDDGTRLVVVDDPIGGGQLGDAAPGALIARPAFLDRRGGAGGEREAGGEGWVEVVVVNSAAVTVSVSSHFHFFEANPRLLFDRGSAFGMHLDVVAGSTVRFDPRVETAVHLVPFGGERVIVGFSGLVDGPLDAPGAKDAALLRARAFGYLDTGAFDADADLAADSGDSGDSGDDGGDSGDDEGLATEVLP